MLSLLLLAWLSSPQAPFAVPIDVKSIELGVTTVAAEIDTSKLKGDVRRLCISSTKDAVLPAWSADGKRLAYLQKTGRKKYLVLWAPVGW
jgi:hypothetical protein